MAGRVDPGWLAWVQAGWSLEALVLALYAWFFLTVAVIDLEHRRVINRMLLAALPLAVVVSMLSGQPPPVSALAGAALGFGLFWWLRWRGPAAWVWAMSSWPG